MRGQLADHPAQQTGTG